MNIEAKQQIAKYAMEMIYEAHPDLWERFGERGVLHTEKDNIHHLDHLESAYAVGQSQLFTDYAVWLETVLVSRNVETALIIENFQILIDIIPEKLSSEEESFMIRCLQEAIQHLDQSAPKGTRL
ncbi:MAG TPA: hypothetical protein VK947_03105 [Planococcus sp. (in: firmicutes)]|nr:hypothetical protein [Planococcus sp. (in: firmicutes)]